jgi:hypothetical protein
MSSSDAGPLAALIRRHRAGRTYTELATASGGVISAERWEELTLHPLVCHPGLPPVAVDSVALALGLGTVTVRHFVLASAGLPVARCDRELAR